MKTGKWSWNWWISQIAIKIWISRLVIKLHNDALLPPLPAKRYKVHFGLKMLPVRAILRAHSRKICLSSVCLQAAMQHHLGRHKQANILCHVISCCILSQLVLFVTCWYLLVSGHCSDCCESVSHRLTPYVSFGAFHSHKTLMQYFITIT